MKSAILSCAIALMFSFGALSAAHAGSATWNLNPASGDWNTASNWMPATVPDGPSDIATFGVSNQVSVVLTESVELNQILFEAGASPFTISCGTVPFTVFNITGAGVINNSGFNQTIAAQVVEGQLGEGLIAFYNNATAGSSITYINSHGTLGLLEGAHTQFSDTSTAGNATIIDEGGTSQANGGGSIDFYDSFSAGNANIIHYGGTVFGARGGLIEFHDASSADHATIVCNGGEAQETGPGYIYFYTNSTAANAAFTINGAAATPVVGGTVYFFDHTSGGDALFTINGGTAPGADGGLLAFTSGGANEATFIANGGTNGGLGGSIYLGLQFHGGRTKIQVYGNATLDVSDHHTPGATIGSLSGNGTVYLGNLTFTVGGDNLDSTFSGVMQNAGSFAKIGTGMLTLSGANTYTGGTAVDAGSLVINNTTGSGTGAGAVLQARS